MENEADKIIISDSEMRDLYFFAIFLPLFNKELEMNESGVRQSLNSDYGKIVVKRNLNFFKIPEKT